METKAEKLERLNRMVKSNQESKTMKMTNFPKEYLLDKIDSLHMFLDTIICGYIDAIEFMTEEQFVLFQKHLGAKYDQ